MRRVAISVKPPIQATPSAPAINTASVVIGFPDPLISRCVETRRAAARDDHIRQYPALPHGRMQDASSYAAPESVYGMLLFSVAPIVLKALLMSFARAPIATTAPNAIRAATRAYSIRSWPDSS